MIDLLVSKASRGVRVACLAFDLSTSRREWPVTVLV